MPNIYSHESVALGALLEKASTVEGATVLIPDLQRPYVWTPSQVILLVDSLIRGWPFGTLLTWKISANDEVMMPCRSFWRLVSRTENENAHAATVGMAGQPAELQMVLDGQQRLQSLLLAFGGDDFGFRLDDRDWKEHVEGERPRGSTPKHPHWTSARLFFNVRAFLSEYEQNGHVMKIDYRRVLQWVAPDGQYRSNYPTPAGYQRPIKTRNEIEREPQVGRRCLIQLSRIWVHTPTDQNMSERQLRDQFRNYLLDTEAFTEDQLQAHQMEALGEFLVALRAAKLGQLTYMEVGAYDPNNWDRQQYSAAIVDIFTRLNTAGRTLTREEITFAWIKTGWANEGGIDAGGDTAKKLFEALHADILSTNDLFPDKKSFGFDLLVKSIAFLWAMRHNNGRTLDDDALLNGETVRPMARDISREWETISLSLKHCVRDLENQGITFGQNRWFNSLNSFLMLLSFYFRFYIHLEDLRGDIDKENALGSFQEQMKHFSGRWLFCATWSGYWSSASADQIRARFAQLHTDLFAHNAPVTELIGRTQAVLLNNVAQDAQTVVENFSVSKPNQVARYYPLLTIWSRMSETRLAPHDFVLRVTDIRRTLKTEVDHIVSKSKWDGWINRLELTEDQRGELVDSINQIGNCMLLEKNFNISKSDQTLSEWLDRLDRFTEDRFREGFLQSLGVTEGLANPDNVADQIDARCREIQTLINDRTKLMRQELIDYIQGHRNLVDL